jgi:hypothetical protein
VHLEAHALVHRVHRHPHDPLAVQDGVGGQLAGHELGVVGQVDPVEAAQLVGHVGADLCDDLDGAGGGVEHVRIHVPVLGFGVHPPPAMGCSPRRRLRHVVPRPSALPSVA